MPFYLVHVCFTLSLLKTDHFSFSQKCPVTAEQSDMSTTAHSVVHIVTLVTTRFSKKRLCPRPNIDFQSFKQELVKRLKVLEK